MHSEFSSLLDQARELDKHDPLAGKKALFDLPDGIIYMDGNSLGALPLAAKDRLQQTVTREWGKGLISSWNKADWYRLPEETGALIAPLIGASPHEVIACDTVSTNIFKLAASALKLNPKRKRIVTEKGNFPTDGYMLQGLTELLGKGYELDMVARCDIETALDSDVALLLLTHVHYITGEIFPMQHITNLAHKHGCLIVWDLSHSTGAVPIDLTAARADFAVGCGYKYLNGGPGAPAYIYVADRHIERVSQPLTGWFGHTAPFDFKDAYTAAPDLRKMLTGTTSVLAMASLKAALSVWEGADMQQVRAKSLKQIELFAAAAQTLVTRHGFQLSSHTPIETRGSHISLKHPFGYAVMQALIHRGVVGDFRAPDFLRFGVTPLYLSYTDVVQAALILTDIMDTGLWQDPRFQKQEKVT